MCVFVFVCISMNAAGVEGAKNINHPMWNMEKQVEKLIVVF